MSADRFGKRFKSALGEYVTYLLDMLEIRDWRIRLDSTPPDDVECATAIKCVYGRRTAGIKLSRDFFDFPPDDQRHYIVHELCHVLTDGLDNVIENGVESLIGKPAFTVLVEAWHVQLEYLTDHLAYIVEGLIAGGKRGDRLWKAVIAAEQRDA